MAANFIFNTQIFELIFVLNRRDVKKAQCQRRQREMEAGLVITKYTDVNVTFYAGVPDNRSLIRCLSECQRV